MDDRKTSGLFGILFEENYGGVVSICCEFGNFPEGELMAVAVGGSRNVSAVWEEGGEEVCFAM